MLRKIKNWCLSKSRNWRFDTLLPIKPSIFYCDIMEICIDPNILCRLPIERQNRIRASIKPIKAKQLYASSLLTFFIFEKYGIKSPAIQTSEYGKPYIGEGLYFNISHSGRFVVLAINPYDEIGIDIQEKNPVSDYAAEMFFSRNILGHRSINERMAFYNSYLWCRYEAFLKCLGVGWNFTIKHKLPVLKHSVHHHETTYYFTDYRISEHYFTTLCEKNYHVEFPVEEVCFRELELFCRPD